MATQILATGTGAGTSSDVTVAAGESLVVALKGYSFDAEVTIKLKDDAAAYNVVGNLNGSNPSRVIQGPGAYQFVRAAGTCGVFNG